MSKKPKFSTTKEQRLIEAKQQLEAEDNAKLASYSNKMLSTTLVLEASLLYAVKELALQRKRLEIKPNTVTGIIKEALQEIVGKKNKEGSSKAEI